MGTGPFSRGTAKVADVRPATRTNERTAALAKSAGLTSIAPLLGILLEGPILAQSNIPARAGVRDAFLVNYDHDEMGITAIPFETPTRERFLPYVAWVDRNGTPSDSLMDGVVLRDSWAAEDATYLGNRLEAFLRDTFDRARMHFVTSFAHYGSGPGRALHLTFEEFVGQRRIATPIDADSTIAMRQLSLACYAAAESTTTTRVRHGFEMYDATGQEIVGQGVGLGGQVSWSDAYHMWIAEYGVTTSWRRYVTSVVIPQEAVWVSVHIGRDGGDLFVDYAQLVAGDETQLLDDSSLVNRQFVTLLTDGGFEQAEVSSAWQRTVRRAGSRSRVSLYADRQAALGGIHDARMALLQHVPGAEPFQVVVMLPTPTNLWSGNLTIYQQRVRSYVDTVRAKFAAWAARNSGDGIELRGFYLVKEGLDSSAVWHALLTWLRGVLDGSGLRLYASPYNASSGLSAQSRIQPEYFPYFDALWFQPNCFDRGGTSTGGIDVDTDRLPYAARYVTTNSLGINIERNGSSMLDGSQEQYAGYGRLLDYLEYGLKYGYVAFTKCYYDNTTLHWWSARSTDTIERKQYDALHEFILSSRSGYVVNGQFETIENGGLLGWIGSYGVAHPSDRGRAYSCMRTAPGDHAMSIYPLQIGTSRRLNFRFEARETPIVSSAYSGLLGMEFFDGNGREVRDGDSNLTWSSYLDMWYRYVPTTSTWTVWDWTFTAPANARYAKIHLRHWSGLSAIEWDNLQAYESRARELAQGWSDQTPIIVTTQDEPVFWRARMSVAGGSSWTVRAQVKETTNDGDPYSGLVRVDVFDASGALLVPPRATVPGLSWSARYGYWYAYIPISTVQNPSPSYRNTWSDWDESFSLPADARAMRVFLYRWTTNGSNQVLFRHPRIERQGGT